MPKDEYHLIDTDGSVQVINTTDVDTGVALAAARFDPLVAALTKWTHDTQGPTGERRIGNMFERDRYVTPFNVFEQMALAREAAESDDVVSTAIDSTESLAFSKMSIEADDPDEDDIYNQIAADLDFDGRLREMWRETFILSQCYVAIWWGRKSYTVSGKSEAGVKRKKRFDNLRVPIGLTLLDPMRILPVGNFMFNQEDLVYCASLSEASAIDEYLKGDRLKPDPIYDQLFIKKYEPDAGERKRIGEYGIAADRLFLLNPKNVFRHTLTRAQHERFAAVRMKSIFEVLDLKQQLRQMDRANLIGSTQYIILIRKGTDEHPAKPEELANLQAQVRTVARIPVITGDHRLSIEIITPAQDKTLDVNRYQGLDLRIQSRLYGVMIPAGGSGRTTDDSIKLARLIARNLESRRHMQKRSLEKYVLEPTFKANDALTTKPRLRFHPKRIALDFDPAVLAFITTLLEQGHLSRDSVLAEIDYDEADEARKRKIEKEIYDKVFVPPVLPQGSPGLSEPQGPAGKQPQNPKSAGRSKGGTRNGGGAAPGTGQGQAPRNPAKPSDGPQRKPKATADLDVEEEP